MNQNKLMEVFDESYQVTFSQIIKIETVHEEAKKLLGLIYKETGDVLTKATNTLEDIRRIFEQTKIRHGIFDIPAFAME